jgi:chromosome partitioning protein
MGMAERFVPVRQNYKHILRQALQSVQMYDTIILDCPPSMGAIVQNAMTAADLLIIPTQPEYFSAYALRNVMREIRLIRESDNPDLMYRILITMLDVRIKSHNTLSEQLRTTFGNAVFETTVQVDSKLRDCTIAGLPVTHFFSRSRSAGQYRALAQELIQYAKSEKVAQPA